MTNLNLMFESDEWLHLEELIDNLNKRAINLHLYDYMYQMTLYQLWGKRLYVAHGGIHRGNYSIYENPRDYQKCISAIDQEEWSKYHCRTITSAFKNGTPIDKLILQVDYPLFLEAMKKERKMKTVCHNGQAGYLQVSN